MARVGLAWGGRRRAGLGEKEKRGACHYNNDNLRNIDVNKVGLIHRPPLSRGHFWSVSQRKVLRRLI